MSKYNLSSILFAAGVAVLLMWGSGSHGKGLEFHPNKIEYWILLLTVIVCFLIPIYYLIGWVVKKLK